MRGQSLTGTELRRWCAGLGFQRTALIASGHLNLDQYDWQPLLEETGSGTFLLCALSCYRREADDLSTDSDPHGLIAPYTRRNFYQEAVVRLKQVVQRISERTGLTKRDLRIFCNSRFPEKPLAAASGLGVYGKNSLILIPGLGSLFVLAGIFLPLELLDSDEPPAARERGLCDGCDRCLRACPADALHHQGVVDTGRCLQALASREIEFSEAQYRQWSIRLYGCQSCQEVCPWNRDLSEETTTKRGELGPSISLNEILSRSPDSLKTMFKGTQMGLSWFPGEAIVRNALGAAGNHGNRVLEDAVQRWIDHPHPLVSGAARWAARSLSVRPAGETG